MIKKNNDGPTTDQTKTTMCLRLMSKRKCVIKQINKNPNQTQKKNQNCGGGLSRDVRGQQNLLMVFNVWK